MLWAERDALRIAIRNRQAGCPSFPAPKSEDEFKLSLCAIAKFKFNLQQPATHLETTAKAIHIIEMRMDALFAGENVRDAIAESEGKTEKEEIKRLEQYDQVVTISIQNGQRELHRLRQQRAPLPSTPAAILVLELRLTDLSVWRRLRKQGAPLQVPTQEQIIERILWLQKQVNTGRALDVKPCPHV